ncbi:ADOP family duplicated permease [Luteitalea sp.]
MRWPARLRHRLRALLTARRSEQDLSDELQFHLEAQVAAYVAEGHSVEAARARALREFGSPDVVAEQCRDARGVRLLTDAWRDARTGWRAARRAPASAAAAVATLALGIGSATAMFSVVDAVLLRPLPFEAPDRLVRADAWVAAGALDVYRLQARAFSTVGLLQPDREVNVGVRTEPERLRAAVASDAVLPLLGVVPRRGRGFTADDMHASSAPVVLLGHDLWLRRFDGRADIVGHAVRVDGVSREVIGVLPPGGLRPLADVDLVLPAATRGLPPAVLWGSTYFQLLGRLRDDVSTGAATADLRRLAPIVRDSYPWRMPDVFGAEVVAVPLLESLVGDVRPRLLALGLAVALVLLSACANVATLVLARAVVREREFAVRAAVGASRRRLGQQLLTETLALWLCGGVLGWGMALLTVTGLQAWLPADVPRLDTLALDGRVLVGTLLITLLTGMAFGLLPAWRMARTDLVPFLKANDGGVATAAGRQWLVKGLVIGQLASAVVLVSGSVLLTRSLWNLSRVAPGFDADDVLSAAITPDQAVCADEIRCAAFYAQVRERLEVLPQVTAVGLADNAPIGGASSLFAIDVDGHPVAPGAPAYTASRLVVTPTYFAAIDQPLVHGRAFTEADGDGGAPVVLVNQAFVRRFWPGQDPIGKRLRYVWQPVWRTVVGVVGDIRQDGLAQASPVAFYVPYGQDRPRDLRLFVESGMAWPALAREVRRVVRGVHPEVPVSKVQPLRGVVEASLAGTTALLAILSVFGAVVLLLGAIGTYGVLAANVSSRRRELGIRLALGASARSIRRLVLRDAATLCAAAFALGVPVAWWSARRAEALLFGTGPQDVTAQLAVLVVMTAVALAAAAVPAMRAARVDPLRSLK